MQSRSTHFTWKPKHSHTNAGWVNDLYSAARCVTMQVCLSKDSSGGTFNMGGPDRLNRVQMGRLVARLELCPLALCKYCCEVSGFPPRRVQARRVCAFLSWRHGLASHGKIGLLDYYLCLSWMCLSWCWIRKQFICTFANYVTVWMEFVRVQRKMWYGPSAYRAHMIEVAYPAADWWSHAVWHLTWSWIPSAMGYSTEGLATSRRAEQKFGFDSPLDISMDRCDCRLMILANHVCMTSWALHRRDMTLVW